MKATVMCVLLCLLSALVEVHCQTVAKIKFRQSFLPNHSYVDFNLVGGGNESVQCRTDLSTCCFFENRPDGGDWYFPNGSKLPTDSEHSIYEAYRNMHVQLCRNNGAEREGIYRCDIETSAANNGSYETLYAGLYFSGGQ